MIPKGHSKPKSTIRKLQILCNTLTFYQDFREMLLEEGRKKNICFQDSTNHPEKSLTSWMCGCAAPTARTSNLPSPSLHPLKHSDGSSRSTAVDCDTLLELEVGNTMLRSRNLPDHLNTMCY